MTSDADDGPEGLTTADKVAAVVETLAMNEAGLPQHSRRRTLWPERLRCWRLACELANKWDRASLALRHGGDFSLLWHNSHLLTRRDRRFFERVAGVVD